MLTRVPAGWAMALALVVTGHLARRASVSPTPMSRGAARTGSPPRRRRVGAGRWLVAGGAVSIAVGAGINWAKFRHPYLFPLAGPGVEPAERPPQGGARPERRPPRRAAVPVDDPRRLLPARRAAPRAVVPVRDAAGAPADARSAAWYSTSRSAPAASRRSCRCCSGSPLWGTLAVWHRGRAALRIPAARCARRHRRRDDVRVRRPSATPPSSCRCWPSAPSSASPTSPAGRRDVAGAPTTRRHRGGRRPRPVGRGGERGDRARERPTHVARRAARAAGVAPAQRQRRSPGTRSTRWCTQVDALPPSAVADALFVVGDCDAVYVATGETFERVGAGGGARPDVPHRRRRPTGCARVRSAWRGSPDTPCAGCTSRSASTGGCASSCSGPRPTQGGDWFDVAPGDVIDVARAGGHRHTTATSPRRPAASAARACRHR